MDKFLHDLLRHLRAMWRYRWLGLLAAWSVAIIGATVVFMTPKKYEASARIFVNTDSILKPLMAGMTVQPDTSQRVALLSKVIISRPNVKQLVQEAGLAKKATSTLEQEKLIDDVMKVLDIETSGERDNIYTLTFRDTEPERARRMVELLVEKFVESSKGGRNSDTDAAMQFLDEQVIAYEKKLQEAETRLKEFKIKNMTSVIPGEGKDYFAQLAMVGEQLNQARLQLREAENSRDAYRKGLAGEDVAAAPTVEMNAGSESISDIDARIDAMKRNLDGLLQKYTESHPDVIGTRRIIRELTEQRSQLVAHYRKAGIPLTQVSLSGPRASEQLKVSLAQAEAAVASLRTRVIEYSTRYSQLQELARRMPQYEAELAQLNRDYEVNKKNYENLVARRESASIASDMQLVSGVEDFRLIDPPRVSPNSVSPGRAKLLAATVLLALGAGTGLMFLAKEIRASFFDRHQLSEITGIPILGSISVISNEQSEIERKKRIQRFVLAAVLLFGIYCTVVVAGLLLNKQPV